MSAVRLDTDDAVCTALAILADLALLSGCEQPLLAVAANRAHAAIGSALANVAPDAFDAVPETQEVG
jgi:hypothetical protein